MTSEPWNILMVVLSTIAPDVRVEKEARYLAKLGNNVTIESFAVVKSNVTLGDNVIINTRASIDHDCVVGEIIMAEVVAGPPALPMRGADYVPRTVSE